jgi:hypothetical protein
MDMPQRARQLKDYDNNELFRSSVIHAPWCYHNIYYIFVTSYIICYSIVAYTGPGG